MKCRGISEIFYLARLSEVDVCVEGRDNGIVHRKLYIVEARHLRHKGDQSVLVDLHQHFFFKEICNRLIFYMSLPNAFSLNAKDESRHFYRITKLNVCCNAASILAL